MVDVPQDVPFSNVESTFMLILCQDLFVSVVGNLFAGLSRVLGMQSCKDHKTGSGRQGIKAASGLAKSGSRVQRQACMKQKIDPSRT
jgi:hypothetical protein